MISIRAFSIALVLMTSGAIPTEAHHSYHVTAPTRPARKYACTDMPYACVASEYVPYQQVAAAIRSQLNLAAFIRLVGCQFVAHFMNSTDHIVYVALHEQLTCTLHGTASQSFASGTLDVTVARITIVGSVVGGAQLVSYTYNFRPGLKV